MRKCLLSFLQEEYNTPSGDSYDFTDEESKLELLEEAEDFPATYDLRNREVITCVKSQSPFGSCWAFAATAAAESSLLNQGFENVDSLDLSEKHLAYFTFTSVWDQSNSQYGEEYKDGGPNGMAPSGKMNIGGNSFLASSIYASGAWLVKNSWGFGENEFPNKGLGTWGIPNEEGQGTGYFWLSYYDHSISSAEAVEFEEDNGYLLESYNYLPAFEMHATEFDQEAKMANIFFAQKNEVLKQISFYTTHSNTSVSYEIYILCRRNIPVQMTDC